jgi:ABC-type transport system involved in multi-copper enzyme maturation permease subunit
MLSVVQRELRAEARHPFTYWARVLAMAGMLGVVVWFAVEEGLRPTGGGELFVWLHGTLLFLIWVFVPLVTADVISRERREGTLGLLFLTPLTAWDIVVAKSLAHGLRAFSFCLAVLPVLTIPFLAGGVSWTEATASALFILGSLCCAVGAGVLASSSCKVWSRSALWAMVIAASLGALFVSAHLLSVLLILGPFLPGFTWNEALMHKFELFMLACAYVTNVHGLWRHAMSQWFTGPPHHWLGVVFAITVLTFIGLLLLIALAARNVRRTWQDAPPSALNLWLQRVLCTPVLLRNTLRRWLRWKLERNPIGWLEQRTWSARLVSWSWLAVLISVYSVALSDLNFYRYHFQRVHNLLSFGLFISMACTAAGSFRRERDNGVLQLLLVSPLSVKQIIGGRVRGLWAQFLPAVLLLIGVWLYLDQALASLDRWQSPVDARIWLYLSTYLSTPVIGLYYSLKTRAFIVALLGTIMGSLILPFCTITFLAVTAVPLYFRVGVDFPAAVFFIVAVQVVVAGLCAAALRRRLTHRQFAFAHA